MSTTQPAYKLTSDFGFSLIEAVGCNIDKGVGDKISHARLKKGLQDFLS